MSARGGRLLPGIAALWAAAEACVFFVLPDALVAPAVIARPRLVVRLVLAALVGSVVGTLALAVATAAYPDATRSLVVGLPFTGEAMFAALADGRTEDLGAVIAQPYSGIPAKVWTWTSVSSSGLAGSALFFVVLAVGRLVRFAAVAGLAWVLELTLGEWIRRFAWVLLPLYVGVFFAGLWLVSR